MFVRLLMIVLTGCVLVLFGTLYLIDLSNGLKAMFRQLELGANFVNAFSVAVNEHVAVLLTPITLLVACAAYWIYVLYVRSCKREGQHPTS